MIAGAIAVAIALLYLFVLKKKPSPIKKLVEKANGKSVETPPEAPFLEKEPTPPPIEESPPRKKLLAEELGKAGKSKGQAGSITPIFEE